MFTCEQWYIMYQYHLARLSGASGAGGDNCRAIRVISSDMGNGVIEDVSANITISIF